MSIIIKSEPISGVVELSSDDEETVSTLSTINIEIPDTLPTGRPSTPDTQCSICLDDLTNKCHSDTCWHLFCFECLVRWSNSEATCPLCKKAFRSIHHSFKERDVHETYDVPSMARIPSPRIYLRPFSEMSDDRDRMFRMNLFLDIFRRNERIRNTIQSTYGDNGLDLNHNNLTPIMHELSQNYPRPNLQRPLIGQGTRIRVYVNNMWAEPLPDTTGRFRDCTSTFYRDNPAQTYRLHGFILRDLVAVRESSRSLNQLMPFPVNIDVAVTNLIMRSLAVYDIRHLHLVSVISPFLGGRAIHFCHELYNFANSPYDINGYDRNVQYTYQPYDSSETPPHNLEPLPPIHTVGETIVLDSDNEEVIRPRIMEVIELISSGDDSDVEILSHTFHPIDPLDSASIDQPSTSTGIRDSLDRPNNRYNLRRRRIFPPTINDSSSFQSFYSGLPRMSCPSQTRRGRPILDTSSDDEELITATQGSQTAHLKSRSVNDKRKKKTKKNKKKKRKVNTDDSRSETHSTNRTRSYSGSSSSSGELDVRPFNSFILPI